MKIAQAVYGPGMRPRFESGDLGGDADLVLLFGSTDPLAQREQFERLRRRHPQAILVGCSSRLGVCGTHVLENSLVATALRFERTTLHIASLEVRDARQSGAAGAALADALPRGDLSHVLVFCDALAVDAARVGAAIRAGLPPGVGLGGWLAGGAGDTLPALLCADRPAASGVVILLGFYGRWLRVACGSGASAGTDPPSGRERAQFAILAGHGGERSVLKREIEREAKSARTRFGEQLALAGFAAHACLYAGRPAPDARALSVIAISEL